jgi:YbbR domain-containing protein
LLSVSPAQVQLAFERLVRKELLVVVNKKGEAAPGFRVEDIVVRPDSIVATGPQTELEGMAAVETDALDISGIDRTRRFEVGIVDQSKLTSLDVHFVSVVVKVMPIMEEQDRSSVPVKVLAPEGYAAFVEPSKVDIRVSGSVLALEQIKDMPLSLVADARGLKDGEHQLSVTGEDLPEGVKIIKTIPDSVTVRLVSKRNEGGE